MACVISSIARVGTSLPAVPGCILAALMGTVVVVRAGWLLARPNSILERTRGSSCRWFAPVVPIQTAR